MTRYNFPNSNSKKPDTNKRGNSFSFPDISFLMQDRKFLILILFFGMLSLLINTTQAADKNGITRHFILYDEIEKVFSADDGLALVDYEELLDLLDKSNSQNIDQPAGGAQALWTSFQCNGQSHDDFVVFQIFSKMDAIGKGWVVSPYAGGKIGVEHFRGEGCLLLPPGTEELNNSSYQVIAKAPGQYSVSSSIAVPIIRTRNRRKFTLEMPVAPASINLNLHDGEYTVEVSGGTLTSSTSQNGKTSVSIVPASGKLSVEWFPKVVTVKSEKKRVPDDESDKNEGKNASEDKSDSDSESSNKSGQTSALLPPESRQYITSRTLAEIGDGLLRTSSIIRCTIVRAPSSILTISLPLNTRIVNITGDYLKNWEYSDAEDHKLIRLQLNSPRTGMLVFHLDIEVRLADYNSPVQIPIPELNGAERHSGALGITTSTNLELSEVDAGNALTQDPSELPVEIRNATANPILLAYRFSREPEAIIIKAQRHKDAEVLTASVDAMTAQTLINGEGLEVTGMSFNVRNASRQYLSIVLPDGLIRSVSVQGRTETIAEGHKENEYLIPLPRSSGNKSFPVEVVYTREGPTNDKLSKISTSLASIDAPVSSFKWDVYVPDSVKALSSTGRLIRPNISQAIPWWIEYSVSLWAILISISSNKLIVLLMAIIVAALLFKNYGTAGLSKSLGHFIGRCIFYFHNSLGRFGKFIAGAGCLAASGIIVMLLLLIIFAPSFHLSRMRYKESITLPTSVDQSLMSGIKPVKLGVPLTSTMVGFSGRMMSAEMNPAVSITTIPDWLPDWIWPLSGFAGLLLGFSILNMRSSFTAGKLAIVILVLIPGLYFASIQGTSRSWWIAGLILASPIRYFWKFRFNRKARTAACALFAIIILSNTINAGQLSSQISEGEIKSDDIIVYIPYSEGQKLDDLAGSKALIHLSDYRKLKFYSDDDITAPVSSTLDSINLSAIEKDRSLQVRATYTVTVLQEKGFITIKLLDKKLPVRSMTIDGKPSGPAEELPDVASPIEGTLEFKQLQNMLNTKNFKVKQYGRNKNITNANSGVYALLNGPGVHKIALDFHVDIQLNSGVSSAIIPLPASSSTLFLSTFKGTDITFESPDMTAVRLKVDNDSTTVTALKNHAGSVSFNWSKARKNPVIENIPAPVENREPEYVVNNQTWYLLEQDGWNSHTRMMIDISNAPLSGISITTPENSTILDITGSAVESWNESDDAALVNFRSGTTGRTMLNIQTTGDGFSESMSLSPPEVLGAIRESGNTAIVSRGNVGVEIEDAVGAIRIDPSELPAEMTSSMPGKPLLSFRNVRRPVKLSLSLSLHKSVKMAEATIDVASAKTSIRENGTAWTRLNMSVRNSSRQFMSVVMPEGSEIMSATVNGEPVKPAVPEKGRLLIALRNSPNRAFPVEITWSHPFPIPSRPSRINASLPQIEDMFIGEIIWDISLPYGHRLYRARGMETISEPLSQSQRMEKKTRRTRNSVMTSSLDSSFGSGAAMPEPSQMPDEMMDMDMELAEEESIGYRQDIQTQQKGKLYKKRSNAFASQGLIPPSSPKKESGEKNLSLSMTRKVSGVLPVNIKIPSGGENYRFRRRAADAGSPPPALSAILISPGATRGLRVTGFFAGIAATFMLSASILGVCLITGNGPISKKRRIAGTIAALIIIVAVAASNKWLALGAFEARGGAALTLFIMLWFKLGGNRKQSS